MITVSESCDFIFRTYKTISEIASANGLKNDAVYIPLKFNHRWKIEIDFMEYIRMDFSNPLLRLKTYDNIEITIGSLIYYGL